MSVSICVGLWLINIFLFCYLLVSNERSERVVNSLFCLSFTLCAMPLYSSLFWYNRVFVNHVVGVIGFLSLSQSLNTQILFPVDVHHL